MATMSAGCLPSNGASMRAATSGRKTIVGQCHRYSEYDRRPTAAGSRAPAGVAADGPHEIQRGDEDDARPGDAERGKPRVFLRVGNLVREQRQRAERRDAQHRAARAERRAAAGAPIARVIQCRAAIASAAPASSW